MKAVDVADLTCKPRDENVHYGKARLALGVSGEDADYLVIALPRRTKRTVPPNAMVSPAQTGNSHGFCPVTWPGVASYSERAVETASDQSRVTASILRSQKEDDVLEVYAEAVDVETLTLIENF